MWSSQALGADYGMLLARTNFDVPKHQGISWFGFSLDQPGVTVRPLREMTGDAVFNEIFLDDAVVRGCRPHRWRGQRLGGHADHVCTSSAPASAPGGMHAGFPEPGRRGGMLGRRAGDAAREEPEDEKLTLGYDDVVELARKWAGPRTR